MPRLPAQLVIDLAETAARTNRVLGVRPPESEDEELPGPARKSRDGGAPIAIPLPPEIPAVLAQQLLVEKAGLPSALVSRLKRDHLEILADGLRGVSRHVIVMRGGMVAKETRSAAARLARHATSGERVIVATGRYVGEGFDDVRLDTLFLTMPVSWILDLGRREIMRVGPLGREHEHYMPRRTLI